MSGTIHFDIVVENKTQRDMTLGMLNCHGGGIRRATGLEMDPYSPLRITMEGSTPPLTCSIYMDVAGARLEIAAETDGTTSSAIVNAPGGITGTTSASPAGQPGPRQVFVTLA